MISHVGQDVYKRQILAFSYAAYLGITCVAKEEKRSTAEYLFTKPVDRSTIVLSKALASAGNLLLYALCLSLIHI